MNKNILIVLAGGFLIAVLVAVMLQATLSGSDKKEVATERIQILVAAKDLKVGKDLKEGDLKWQDWPKETSFIGAIVRDDEQPAMGAIEGKLLRSLVKGQPVHSSLVVEEDKGDFLSANVGKGMRAVGVSVKSYVVADRLMRPGDFVDVMVTYKVSVNRRSNPEAANLVSKYATETIIENVRVLAIDSEDTKAVDEEEVDEKIKKKSSKKATITLEVTPDGAEELVLADRMGDIGFALRSIGDTQPLTTDLSTTDVGMSKVMTTLTKMTGTSSAVRIYNGDQTQEVKARQLKEESNVHFSIEQEAPPEQKIIITPEALEQLGNEE